MTWVSHLKKAEQRLKTCEDYSFCRERHGHVFWDSQGVLVIDFLVDNEPSTQLIIPSFLKTESKASLSFKTTRSMSQKCLSPPWQHASAHRRCDNRWEVLPHPAYSPDLAPSDFHPIGPLKGALGGKGFRSDDEINFFSTMVGRATTNFFFERGLMKLPYRWRRCIEVQGEYVQK
jgi:histone-lysine N-methyltransferase SETMAR